MPSIFVSFWSLSAIGVIWKLQAFVTLHRLHRRSRKGTIAWIMTFSYACVDWSLHLIVKPGCVTFSWCVLEMVWYWSILHALDILLQIMVSVKLGAVHGVKWIPKLMQFSLSFCQHLNNDDSFGMFSWSGLMHQFPASPFFCWVGLRFLWSNWWHICDCSGWGSAAGGGTSGVQIW
jgi:hypothetical protein